MANPLPKNSSEEARDLRSSLLHLTVYSVLLLSYFFLVLRFLSKWLTDLFHHHRVEYAIAAILIMIVQAVVLETISYWILKLIRGKRS